MNIKIKLIILIFLELILFTIGYAILINIDYRIAVAIALLHGYRLINNKRVNNIQKSKKSWNRIS